MLSGANVNQTASTNRTIWPLTGGSLNLDLHHPWTYVFVNLGLGTDYPTFNISLTPQPLNETGNGTLCLPHILLPAGTSVVDGQNASIQVVTFGQTGSALYNVSLPCPLLLVQWDSSLRRLLGWNVYDEIKLLTVTVRRHHL
jgi:hypothetical protein